MPEDFTTRYDLGYRNGRQQAYFELDAMYYSTTRMIT